MPKKKKKKVDPPKDLRGGAIRRIKSAEGRINKIGGGSRRGEGRGACTRQKRSRVQRPRQSADSEQGTRQRHEEFSCGSTRDRDSISARRNVFLINLELLDRIEISV